MDTENKTKTSIQVRLSCLVMGLGQIANRQIIKGVLYLLCLGLFLAYMFSFGINDLKGFFTLGTTEADPWLGIKGDDSIMMLLRGMIAVSAIVAIVIIYINNIKDIIHTEEAQRCCF